VTVHAARLVGLALAALALAACSSLPPRDDPGMLGVRAAQVALDMKGAPYRYGGSTPRGFDCSGLVQYSYARAGARLPRSTEGQWEMSRAIATRGLRPGDLLYFDQEGKRNAHVAIYIGNDRFVHAPSTGKYVTIGNLADAYWRRHLAGARRPNLD
jgi:murein DD-endopeptidase